MWKDQLKSRSRFRLFLLVCLVITAFLLCNSTKESSRKKVLPLRHPVETKKKKNGTEGRRNVCFLKTLIPISNIAQNIFLRYGYTQNLDFVLPEGNNYFENSSNLEQVDPELRSTSGKYNILAHQTRFVPDAVKKVMYEDAAYVTILHEPVDLLNRIYTGYDSNKEPFFNWKELLQNASISKMIESNESSHVVDYLAWDLGYEPPSSPSNIKFFIDSIEEQFDLVMISEYFEASLVLLADLMKWPLEAITFFMFAAPPDPAYLDANDKDMLKRMSKVDWELYKHFVERLKKQIRTFGEERIAEKIQELSRLNTEWAERCFGSTEKIDEVVHTKISDRPPAQCYHMAKSEVEFTNEIRDRQRRRSSVINKLRSLLGNLSLQ